MEFNFKMSDLNLSVKVIVLHKDGMAASEHRREVVDECSLFLHRTREMVPVFHGWRTESKEAEISH